jgi:hypothetical protein
MANFLLLYSGGSMPEGEAAQKQVMEAWGQWFGKLGDALVDGGNPTTPQSKTISSDGTVTDSPATVSGYSIIKANSLDDATETAKGCPVLEGGAKVMVFETFAAM